MATLASETPAFTHWSQRQAPNALDHIPGENGWPIVGHTIELLAEMAPHLGDQKKLIKVARQGREQLEAMWSRERAERGERQARRGEGFTATPRDGD